MVSLTRLAHLAYNTLPSLPTREERGKILTRLFEDTLMFVGANVMLALRGHPVFFISGYFTGIVLDKAVQENFEKIKRVALFTIFIPICCGQESLPYLVHTATFILGAKIGSVLSIRYNSEPPIENQEQKKKEFSFIQNIWVSAGAGLLWLLKGHPFLMLAGFISGTVMEHQTENNFNKLKKIYFGDPLIILAHGWFLAANWPFIRHATTIVIAAKIGSLLTFMSLPKPDGIA